MSGEAQVVPQVPPEQTWPLWQGWLQLPQLALSVVMSTHDEPHSMPVVHWPLQVPATQTVPLPQAMPHAPQLAGSLAVSVQAPLQVM
jgi:hypothetical protein